MTRVDEALGHALFNSDVDKRQYLWDRGRLVVWAQHLQAGMKMFGKAVHLEYEWVEKVDWDHFREKEVEHTIGSKESVVGIKDAEFGKQ